MANAVFPFELLSNKTNKDCNNDKPPQMFYCYSKKM